MAIGANIKKRRFELRMTQQELADAMGYRTRSTIAKIESEENDVSQKKLLKFANVLGTTVEALITGQEAAFAPSVSPILQDEGREKHIAVILAGGKSGNNRQNIPSQYINVHGKPIIVYSMEAYQAHPSIDGIYVVCAKNWESIIRAYAQQYGITKLQGLISAGSSGILSLKNAVNQISSICSDDDLILIQEATRPLVSAETISKLLQACISQNSATICHSMQEYVQFDVSNGSTKYLDRNTIIALQSPEAHRFSLLTELFEKAELQHHPLNETNCTMLLHNLGYKINFIEGNVNNIKISREEDIAAFGAAIMSNALYN